MFPQFDPSKMDPKVLMEFSRMIQSLPPDMINRMQTIMHNAMAGYDVRAEMDEFEKHLPPGFRDKLMTLMAGQLGAFDGLGAMPGGGPAATGMAPTATVQTQGGTIDVRPPGPGEPTPDASIDVHNARLTVLRAVSEGRMAPEDAEKLLFG